ncbi:MAG: DUF503 domain-containing protein, partial [Chloroflexi bacterium]|nr:DUF503 domain-containing protein [Chloroflexota bacterium]
VKSLLERTRNRFNVAAAEVEEQDTWQIAVLGFACVSSDAQHANEVLSNVADFVENSRVEAEVLDYEIEIIHV